MLNGIKASQHIKLSNIGRSLQDDIELIKTEDRSLIHFIACFNSVYMSLPLKLEVAVQKIFVVSKRFLGVPSLFNYAMADGSFLYIKM